MTQTVLLGDIVRIKGGKRLPKESSLQIVMNNHPYLRIVDMGQKYVSKANLQYVPDDIFPKISRYITNTNDVLISIVGTIGLVAIVDEGLDNASLTENCVKLTCDTTKIDPDFLYYFLTSSVGQDEVRAGRVGSSQPKLPLYNIAKIRIPKLNLSDQKQISVILSILDEKIELNRKMNEMLEQMGQALFKHYFITNTAAKEWRSGKFSDIADVLTGKGSTKSQLLENGKVPLYGANGIMGTSEDYLYNEPLVITGRVGTLGKVRMTSGPVWLSDNVLIMRPKGKVFGYMYQLARSFDYISMNRGSSQPLVTQTDLKNRTILIPDTKILEQFEQQFNLIYARQKNNEEEIQTLTTLRDTLLPRLISGKIKV